MMFICKYAHKNAWKFPTVKYLNFMHAQMTNTIKDNLNILIFKIDRFL